MKISAIRSDKVYSKIMNAPLDKKNDIYRYELMKPFEKKWACYSVPMKALTPNGYDVIMASEMLGHIAPTAVDQKQQNNIKLISDKNHLSEKDGTSCNYWLRLQFPRIPLLYLSELL